jgi:16S rRNA (uracil1498-N3)-methyltransferase
MQLFYIPDIENEVAYMSMEESHHCIKVLRMTKGSNISFVDGLGGMYQGEITEADSKKCKISISHYIKDFEFHNYHLHIAIAPTKNMDRIEWFLEKAVEIGVDEISPIICLHSEREKIREDRFHKIMVSAMKQSVKAKLPVLRPLQSFKNFINNKVSGNKYIAHCFENYKDDLLFSPSNGNNFTVLIGPEGDFDESEVKMAIENDYTPVSLGNSRLRTETAGVVAAQIIANKQLIQERETHKKS